MAKRMEIGEKEWAMLAMRVQAEIRLLESVQLSAIEMRLSANTVRKFLKGDLNPTWLTKLKIEKWLSKREKLSISRDNYNE